MNLGIILSIIGVLVFALIIFLARRSCNKFNGFTGSGKEGRLEKVLK